MNKDERIAELENEVKKKDELIKQLSEANKFLSSDKAVSTEQVKQIAREAQLKVMKENIEIIYSTIHHEICEKIRNKLLNSSALVIYHDEDYDRFKEIIDQIEQAKESIDGK